MKIWNRFFGNNKASFSSERDRSLIDEPKKTRSGKAKTHTEIELMPWSATRLAGIFNDLQTNTNSKTIGESRRARQCLSKFWLHAPVDQLEGLYRSPVGQCYRMLLKTEFSAIPLLTEEQLWRDGLTKKLSKNMDHPETVNLLLAAMPYFEKGKLRLVNATDVVPQWLIGDYSALFDPGLARLLNRTAGLLGPTGTTGASRMNSAPQYRDVRPQQQTMQQPQPSPQMQRNLPVMGKLRGNEAIALVQNKGFIDRMNGMVNLYTIDPNDAEVKRELIGLRRQLGQIWLDLNSAQLQALYQSSFGQLYRNFLGCGFSRELLIQEDQQLRSELAGFVSNMGHPKSLNALLAALPYFTPGKIQIKGSEQFLPQWLIADINALNGQ